MANDKLKWSDHVDPEVIETKITPGRCDYCNGRAVRARALCLPDTPSRYTEKGEGWKPPTEGKCHLSFPVETCAECENRFSSSSGESLPVPYFIVEIMVGLVKEWHTEEFDGEIDFGSSDPEETAF